ncbi:putative RNA-directed DNA polymerase from transposon X-element [Trichonephila clavipes]|nr:putative RNA-directed DNA polymerase from transposon X-element [Trichonephila clavipes]
MVKAVNDLYRDFTISILETSDAVYSPLVDVASLIGQAFSRMYSPDSYSTIFLTTKNCSVRTPINFSCRQYLPHHCDFVVPHNTTLVPDGISYEIFLHLNDNSLLSLPYLLNQIWIEQVNPNRWQEAVVILMLKPGKDPKNPVSNRLIALMSCFCKTLLRMVNARFFFCLLEMNRGIPPFLSGFGGGRSITNNILLESKTRNAFNRKNYLFYLVSKKAYDRT